MMKKKTIEKYLFKILIISKYQLLEEKHQITIDSKSFYLFIFFHKYFSNKLINRYKIKRVFYV